jgi:hypothetical protein
MPKAKPWAVGQHLIVPSICSRYIAWAEWPDIRSLEHLFELLDFINNALNVHFPNSIANRLLQPNGSTKHRTCMPKQTRPEAQSELLRGWQRIAAFLGQPVSVAQRWAAEGMPVRKQGRYVETSREELNRWLGRESSGEPVQIATADTDLSAELRRGLAFVRKQDRRPKKKAA